MSITGITVIVPTYNRSDELRRALNSLAKQSDNDFDVFVCDDGSSEDIEQVVDQFRDRLDIQYQRIPNSGGPARPRNVGLAQARSEWVSFLDSDDWWVPGRIAAIKRYLTDDVDVVFHGLRVTSSSDADGKDRGNPRIGESLRNSDPLIHMLRFGNPIPTSGVVVRAQRMREIDGFSEDQELISVEDFDAWLRLAAKGARFHYVREVLGFYWLGTDNISHFEKRQYECQRALFARQLSTLPEEYIRIARSNFNYLLGSYELTLGLPDSGRLIGVEFTVEPLRWLKARAKLLTAKLITKARP